MSTETVTYEVHYRLAGETGLSRIALVCVRIEPELPLSDDNISTYLARTHCIPDSKKYTITLSSVRCVRIGEVYVIRGNEL